MALRGKTVRDDQLCVLGPQRLRYPHWHGEEGLAAKRRGGVDSGVGMNPWTSSQEMRASKVRSAERQVESPEAKKPLWQRGPETVRLEIGFDGRKNLTFMSGSVRSLSLEGLMA
ncbi:hypothetical protein QC761_302955 [Podospora bellae-mahoneyi]|uniref:Uncharacterized protein n=1 Tax=Podospora bellae-mahoneyi TaxID=2093777 RepID=A0ABR0FMG6_9PEZI|nr:hypothetical protein QC761_302955 [Podospora bellae-mahoneyi]